MKHVMEREFGATNMTNDERDELSKAIGTARKVVDELQINRPGTPKDYVAFGALVRAVELLAGSVSPASTAFDFASRNREPTREPLSSAEQFGDALVERLGRISWESDERNADIPWQALNDGAKKRIRAEVRAILAELAKTPVKLPTSEPIQYALDSCDIAGRGSNFHKSMWFAQWLRDNLTPFLAAKDARIAELEARTPANDDRGGKNTQYEITIEQQREKIEELEKSVERKDAEHSITIEKAAEHANRAAELKKQIADGKRFTDEWHEAVDALCELWPEDEPIEANPPLGSWIRRLVALKEKRIAELEKRLADMEKDAEEKHAVAHAYIVSLEKRLTPPVVDGKTPGEVLILAQHGCRPVQVSAEMLESAERDAQAVLGTFGNQRTREALGRVREFAQQAEPSSTGMVLTIDAELARLGTSAPSSSLPDTSTESVLPDPVLRELQTNGSLSLAEQIRNHLAGGDEWSSAEHWAGIGAAEFITKRLEKLASSWEKGSQHEPMPEEYRRALKDCAKELREFAKLE